MMSYRSLIILSSVCRRTTDLKTSLGMFKSLINCRSSLYAGNTYFKCNQIRFLVMEDIDPSTPPKKKPERAKTLEIPKITLLDSSNNITVRTMEQAEKIAASKKLRLVRIVDPHLRTQRPTYKLMTEAEYLEEELKQREKLKEEKKEKKNKFVKGEKLMTLSTRISQRDIETKIQKSIKWLQKRYEVRIIILGSADNTQPQEEIYKQYEKAFKDIGRILQKRIKNGDLRFQIIPPKRETEDNQKADESKEEGINKTEAVKESVEV